MTTWTEPTLFDTDEWVFAPTVAHVSIDDAFEAFHDANPWVYNSLVHLARELTAAGRTRIGMKMLFEVLRWQWSLRTTDPTVDFKLNNNYTSRYARLIMDHEPDLMGVFETRALTS